MKRRDFIKSAGLGAVATAISGCGGDLGGSSKEARIKGKAISFERKIPVRHEVDVFVAGGGPAGAAASIAAARQGAKVYLAEGHSCFGGMGTAGRVPNFMRFGDGVNFLADGVGRKIYNRLKESGKVYNDRIHASVSIDAEILKRVYDELITEAKVDFTFHTHLIAVEKKDAKVRYAICAAKSGLFAVKAKTFVDATGNGDLCAWAGAPYEKGDKDGNLMPGTHCSLWADIDWDKVYHAKKEGQNPRKKVLQAIEDGLFTYPDRHLPGISRIGEHLGGGNIGHTFGVDGTDEKSLTKALVWGRKLTKEYETFYKQYLKGYENMSLAATGSLLGVRETRRITGDYVMDLDDFKRRAVFEDEIGRYNYPVDIHPIRPNKKTFEKFTKEITTLRCGKGESYGIPFRSLTPKGLGNVLVAGRCISTDRYVQSSLRVMPGCFITGQAAGVAAAMTAEKKTTTRNLDVKQLQQRLKEMGAYLPNI
jgi:ribulose 1,5-bisphosphate synthetase/thiazole synthase